MTTSSNICLYVYDIFGPTFVWIWSYSLARTSSLHPRPPSPMCQLLTFPPELAMASLRQPLPGHEPYNACWELGCCQNNQGVNNASLECSTRQRRHSQSAK